MAKRQKYAWVLIGNKGVILGVFLKDPRTKILSAILNYSAEKLREEFNARRLIIDRVYLFHDSGS